MASPYEALKQKVLDLPASMRAELADALIVSLDDPADTEVEAAWTTELLRRREVLERDPSLAIPGEQAFDEAYAALGLKRGK